MAEQQTTAKDIGEKQDGTRSTAKRNDFSRALRRALRPIHRWMGLVALLWLAVLGLTGVVLDHPEWRWANQWTLTEAMGSDHVLQDEVRGTIMRQFLVNGDDEQQMIGGGLRGLWRSTDGGQTWNAVAYADYGGTPQLQSMVPDANEPWQQIWLGTDDGIWRVSGATGDARIFALPNLNITSLTGGATDNELIGSIDNGRIFRMDMKNPDQIRWVEVARIDIKGMPDEIGLSRFLTDLHFGNGILMGSASVLVSDFGGIAIVLLCLTGLLQWLLPRYWRKHRAASAATGRRSTLQWMFRLHAPVIGVVAIIPIIFLCVSGIVFDHPREIIGWTNPVHMPRAALPPAYSPKSLEGEIRAIALDPTRPDNIYVNTRLGVFISDGAEGSWTFDDTAPLASHLKGGLIGLTRKGNAMFLGTHGGPNYVKYDGSSDWQQIPGLRMMIQDPVKLDDTWYLKGSRGFYKGSLGGDLEKLDIQLPNISGMPVYNFLVDMHTGLMFHDQWIWLNDIVAVIAILLALTGFINWFYRIW